MSMNNSNSGMPVSSPGATRTPVSAYKRGHALHTVIILLLIAVIGLGVLRYFGPIIVTYSFMNDIYSYNSSAALNLVCPSKQDQARQQFQSLGILGSIFKMKIDTSNITYTIQEESLDSASVKMSGSITANSITSQKVSEIVTLKANGLWWCVTTDSATSY